MAKSQMAIFACSVEHLVIDAKVAENRRKKRYQSFIISCQNSVKDLHMIVYKLKTKVMIQAFSYF